MVKQFQKGPQRLRDSAITETQEATTVRLDDEPTPSAWSPLPAVTTPMHGGIDLRRALSA